MGGLGGAALDLHPDCRAGRAAPRPSSPVAGATSRWTASTSASSCARQPPAWRRFVKPAWASLAQATGVAISEVRLALRRLAVQVEAAGMQVLDDVSHVQLAPV